MDNINAAVVYVCPDKDIECGQYEKNWCAVCPQRATLKQSFAQPAQPSEPTCENCGEPAQHHSCTYCGYSQPSAPVVLEGKCAANGVWHCQSPICSCRKSIEPQRDERAQTFDEWYFEETQTRLKVFSRDYAEGMRYGWQAAIASRSKS